MADSSQFPQTKISVLVDFRRSVHLHSPPLPIQNLFSPTPRTRAAARSFSSRRTSTAAKNSPRHGMPWIRAVGLLRRGHGLREISQRQISFRENEVREPVVLVKLQRFAQFFQRTVIDFCVLPRFAKIARQITFRGSLST